MSIDDIRQEKANKYKELIKNRNSKEYEMWFLKYSPHKMDKTNKYEVSDKELEWSEKLIEKKKNEKIKKEKDPKTIKKRERNFIERFINSPKTKKNRKSEFLF